MIVVVLERIAFDRHLAHSLCQNVTPSTRRDDVSQCTGALRVASLCPLSDLGLAVAWLTINSAIWAVVDACVHRSFPALARGISSIHLSRYLLLVHSRYTLNVMRDIALTPEQISPTKRRMARPKRYGKPYLLRLSEETWERMEAVRDGQDRADIIREAVERELRRRERARLPKPAERDHDGRG